MKPASSPFLARFLFPAARCCLAVFCFGVIAAFTADAREVSLPAVNAIPGMLVQVPVLLSDAAGTASLRVVVNFNPQLLQLKGVTAGTLGSSYAFSPSAADGVAQLLFVRETDLGGGSGRLAVLTFRVAPGAQPGDASSLTIADFGAGNESGLVDLATSAPLRVRHGTVTVSRSSSVDNDADGLPDDWETARGLSMLDADAGQDPDGDGLVNLAEYAFGGDPRRADMVSRVPAVQLLQSGDGRFLSVTFQRRVSPLRGLEYRVEESLDLVDWRPVDSALHQAGPATPSGDGTERVTIRGTLPLFGSEAAPAAFMRVRISGPSP